MVMEELGVVDTTLDQRDGCQRMQNLSIIRVLYPHGMEYSSGFLRTLGFQIDSGQVLAGIGCVTFERYRRLKHRNRSPGIAGLEVKDPQRAFCFDIVRAKSGIFLKKLDCLVCLARLE